MAVTLALAGDTMLGCGVAELLAMSTDPAAYLSDGVRAHLAEADAVLLNLEYCVSDRGTPWSSPGKIFHFRAPPQAVELLAELGVSCVTLANNHALDYGHDTLLDTLADLELMEIHAVGADQAQARRPVTLAVRGLRIAVIGVTDHPAEYAARPDRPGVAYADLESGVPSWLTDTVARARAEADAVLVTPIGAVSRPEVRCRGWSRFVSSGRSPNPPCGSHRNGLSTESAVRLSVLAGQRQGLGILLPRWRYRVMGTRARSNSSMPSAVMGFHRPEGVVSQRRTSFHFHRCRTISHLTTRCQTKFASILKVCLATACLK